MLFKQSPLFLLLGLVANGIAYSFFAITLPSLGRQLDFSDTNTSLILGISALTMTVVSPFWGAVCDRWGRRKVILAGLTSATLFNILSMAIIQFRLELLVTTQLAFTLLLTSRIINSLSTGGLKPAGQAYIADTTALENRARGMGLLGAAFGLGSIIGGAIAMAAGAKHIIEAYMVISCLLGFCLLLTTWRLPESAGNSGSQEVSTGSLPYRKIMPFFVLTFIGLTAFAILQHVVALTFEDKFMLSGDRAIRQSGMTMMLTMVMMILTQSALAFRLKFTPATLICVGSASSAVALFLAANAPTPAFLTASIAGFGLGLGLMLPGNLAAISLLAPSSSQARAAGINGIGQGLGLAAGPILAVTLHKFNYSAPYINTSVVLFLVALIAFKMIKFPANKIATAHTDNV